MDITVLLSVAAEALPERTAVSDGEVSLDYARLESASSRLAATIIEQGRPSAVAYLGTNSAALPVLLFAAAKAGVPFVPLNYRLSNPQLVRQIERLGPAVLATDEAGAARVRGRGQVRIENARELLSHAMMGPGASLPVVEAADPTAGWLFTSGTTGEPKVALLGHANLVSYALSTVEPLTAEEDEAALVSVPPYHIAGIAAVLTSVFAGRRIVYLSSFDPGLWLRTAEREQVTQSMVVPTMLQRLLPELRDGGRLPRLRSLSYGGGRMPASVITEAVQLLPHVDFTNAYGLTETSSTITVLGPEDHRNAIASADPAIQARLGSVGRPVPGIDLEIRGTDGLALPAGRRGRIWVHGPQVSGAYRDGGSALVDGWFDTRDEGWLDEAGYLYLLGRVDDVIVRGGENISPGEIEDVLRADPTVADVAVVAAPDDAWGEVPVAVIVPAAGAVLDTDALSTRIRAALRSSRLPDRYVVAAELPYNETGKLLRTRVRADLLQSVGSASG